MIAPDEYVAAVDPEEHPNTVVMAGALHAALFGLGQLKADAEVLNGQVTGRLIVTAPFLQSPYLITIERMPDAEPGPTL
jgi:hypothetical protein